MKKIRVLSLFDGLSGGRIALDRLGFNVKKYYASEIDKFAITVAKANYPETIHLGSIINLKKKDLKKLKIDLLIGGSPCQGFSVSGNMKGSSTKEGIEVTSLEQYKKLKKEGFEFEGQSYLFWEYVRIWKIIKPKYFFLENVRVTKKWLPMFNETMGVEPILINSALVSAQNRNRFYWTNISNPGKPEDKGILLKDILVNGIATKEMTTNEKSFCMTARYNGAVAWNSIARKQRTMVKRPCTLKKFNITSICHHSATATDIKGNESIKRVYSESGKAPTLTTMQGGHREPKILIVPEATKKGFTEIKEGNCFDFGVPNSKARRGRNMEHKSYCLQASHEFMQFKNSMYRKLTPLECERLQTLPDNYTAHVSNSQRYKMIGNGWTIDVITHFFKEIRHEFQ